MLEVRDRGGKSGKGSVVILALTVVGVFDNTVGGGTTSTDPGPSVGAPGDVVVVMGAGRCMDDEDSL